MMDLLIQVTAKCNYTCGMCPFHGEGYSGDYFGERPELKREMTLEEIEEILKKAQDFGVETIDLTPNGEFFTYKQWREVLGLIQKYKMKSRVTSNGGLLEEQDIKDALDLGLSQVALSIDSVNYETYKIVRKPATKKTFENAINAPILFKKYSEKREPPCYVQVQFTEQPENQGEIQAMLDFYRPYELNQITVGKMCTLDSQKGVEYKEVENTFSYEVGQCPSYGTYIIQTSGSFLGCRGQFYFYPRLKDKIPNIFTQSFAECKKQCDDLYLHNDIFIDYCHKCSYYTRSNQDFLQKTFIEKGYFAQVYLNQIRYFVIPAPLRELDPKILLFMYKKNMVKEIKDFIKDSK